MTAVIECADVVKRYGETTAVGGVSFTVTEGEIFGLVGPNGAGKTTLIEMIESLRKPDSGTIRVLGMDPDGDSNELQEKIGVQLQTTSIQPNLKVSEAIALFASLYRKPVAEPLAILEKLSLQDKANSRFKTLSGGQQQRVAIALALVNDPDVLFFDEISTGLDPQARRSMWELIRGFREQGKTVFMTTHYMEEAEELCDRVAVIDNGVIIALDTPSNLVRNISAESRITFSIQDGGIDAEVIRGIEAVERVEISEGGFTVYTHDENAALQGLVRLSDSRKFRITDLHMTSASLDDVFLRLTGKEMRE